MNIPASAILIYGLLVSAGGWFGYRKAGSRPSLISGVISGVLLAAAAGMVWTGAPAGVPLAAVVAFVLLAFFGYRLARGGRFMPAGMMVLLSLATLAVLWLTRPQ